MRYLLAFAALAEAMTGLALLVDPPLVVKLLFGGESEGIALLTTRVAGIALIGLAFACWPGRENLRALCGMITYNSLIAMYLAYVGATSRPIGILLWPAVGLHLILSILLGLAWSNAGAVRNRPFR